MPALDAGIEDKPPFPRSEKARVAVDNRAFERFALPISNEPFCQVKAAGLEEMAVRNMRSFGSLL